MEKKSVEQKARILVDSILCEKNVAPYMDQLNAYHPVTFAHSVNVGFIAAQMGYSMNLDYQKLASTVRGAVLHDIGKLDVPLTILDKKGPLSAAELKEIRLHPVYGYKRMICLDNNGIEKNIILHHHERTDGTGYPDGKKCIQIETQLVMVADVWDAMTAKRPYKTAYSGDIAYLELRDMANICFDEVCLNFLSECRDK